MALASYQPELQYVIINLQKGGFFLLYSHFSSDVFDAIHMRVRLFRFLFLLLFSSSLAMTLTVAIAVAVVLFLADVCVSNDLSTVV